LKVGVKLRRVTSRYLVKQRGISDDSIARHLAVLGREFYSDVSAPEARRDKAGSSRAREGVHDDAGNRLASVAGTGGLPADGVRGQTRPAPNVQRFAAALQAFAILPDRHIAAATGSALECALGLRDPLPRRSALRTAAALAGASLDAGLWQLWRESCEMCGREGLRGHRPDGTLVATT